MGKKRTEREAEVELAQNAGNINNNDLELKLVNGDRDEKRKEKKKKKKKEERSERVVEAQDAEKSRPEIESEVVNSDSKDKKKKKEKLMERNGAVSNELPTVSIALPGSIIDNAQSLELATRLAGQIARAVTIFRIDEVVVFDNMGNSQDSSGVLSEDNLDENESGAAFLLMILRYMETPQYLRKSLFPMHNNLRFVGSLPPLDAPHHLRKHEWAPYREGVTLRDRHPNSGGTLVDVGLSKHVQIDQVIDPGKRVTVSMGTDRNLDSDLPHQVVSSSTPREEAGMYWGYRVRYASNISSVFKNCPYKVKGGYDHLIGTSEHGITIKSSELSLPSFRHLLIAFGGLAGLEECIEEDSSLKGKNAQDIFDQYLNTCPHQGSRTIRTEEAILISLQYFQEPINRVLGES
nr:putative methyltransferase C9orf114 [Ipomoea trifida]